MVVLNLVIPSAMKSYHPNTQTHIMAYMYKTMIKNNGEESNGL